MRQLSEGGAVSGRAFRFIVLHLTRQKALELTEKKLWKEVTIEIMLFIMENDTKDTRKQKEEIRAW